MTLRGLWLCTVLAASSISPAMAQGVPFPCAELDRGEPRIFSDLAPNSAESVDMPVAVRRGAILARQERLFLSEWMTVADTALATASGTTSPILFRPYRIAGAKRFCTMTQRDDIFGPPPAAGNYLLKCLVDADGDGQFEAFRRHGELVSYNLRTGERGSPSGIVQQDQPLQVPFALVPTSMPKTPMMGFEPRLQSRLDIIKMDKAEITLRWRTQVSTEPGKAKFRGGGFEERHVMPLQDGARAALGEYTVELHQTGRKWTATASPDEQQAEYRVCDGSVLQAGGLFWIVSALHLASYDPDKSNKPVQ